MKISQWIRDRRVAAGLTQAELAAKTGVTQPIVSQWERGLAEPSPIALQKLRGLFGDPAESSSPPPSPEPDCPLGDRISLHLREDEIILKPVHRTILDLQGSVQPNDRPEDFGSIRRQVAVARGRARAKPDA